MLKLWIAAIGFSGVLSLVMAAQETASPLEAPITASVSASEHLRLVPGITHTFLLTLDSPRHVYEGKGEIRYTFEKAGSHDSQTEVDRYKFVGRTDVLNGQANYDLSIHITYEMLPGTWKLTDVTIGGQHKQTPVSIRNIVTFEILQVPPVVVHFHAPGSVSVGQQFLFKLLLDQTQNGYEGSGLITYRFHKVGSTLPEDYSEYNQPAPNPALRHGRASRNATVRAPRLDFSGSAPLHDNQVNYPFSLLISDEMSPGTWKLTDVTIVEKNDRKPVSILGNVTFEILPSLPMGVHIHALRSVMAGQHFTFNITIDEYPKGLPQGCGLKLSGVLRSAGPKGQPDLNAYQIPLNDVVLKPDRLSYDMSGLFDPDLPSGPWQGEVHIGLYLPQPTSWGTAETYSELLPLCSHSVSLHQGNDQFSFTLEASDLLTPNSATVIVNPSQIQLLLAAADRLRAKAQRLKQQLSSENAATNHVLLRDNVQEAKEDLNRTEMAYKEKGTEPSPPPDVNIFFNDIRLHYDEALKTIASDSAQARRAGPRLMYVSSSLGSSAPHLNPSEAVIASIMQNYDAFYSAASSKHLDFTLRVVSHPDRATISYRRLGDPYETYHDLSDTNIHLTKAIWYIRLRKTGYTDWEGSYNGAKETEPLDIRLISRGGIK